MNGGFNLFSVVEKPGQFWYTGYVVDCIPTGNRKMHTTLLACSLFSLPALQPQYVAMAFVYNNFNHNRSNEHKRMAIEVGLLYAKLQLVIVQWLKLLL